MVVRKKFGARSIPYEIELERMGNRFKYLLKKDRRHGKVNYSDLDTVEMSGEEMIPDLTLIPVEDVVLERILIEALRQGVTQLSGQERMLIHAIYYRGLSEREAAKTLGMHYMTLHDRKIRILTKLKKMLEE